MATAWYPSPGGYAGTRIVQTLTPMPPLLPFPNEFESDLRSLMTSNHESSSDSSTEWGMTPSILTAPIMSGLNLPPSIEKSWELPAQMPGILEDGTSRNEPIITSLGPKNPWTSTSPLTEESHSMPQGQPLSRRGLLPTGIGLYSPQPQAADYMGYVSRPRMSRQHWNSPLPILSAGSDQWADGPGIELPFHFDEETLGNAIRAAGDNLSLYWGSPFPLPDSPPICTGGNQEQGIQCHGYNL